MFTPQSLGAYRKDMVSPFTLMLFPPNFLLNILKMATQDPVEKAPDASTVYTDDINQPSTTYHHTDYEKVAIHTDTYDISAAALGTDVGPGYWKNWRFIGLIVALCLGYNSSNLGYVLSSYSLTRINNDIGPSDNLLWVPLAYTLALSVSFLLVGRFSDIFGRRVSFQSSLSLLTNPVVCMV